MPLRRREFVRAGVTICVAALAGCSDSGGDTSTDDATTTASDDATSTATTATTATTETTVATTTETATETATPTTTETRAATTTPATTHATTTAEPDGGGTERSTTASRTTDATSRAESTGTDAQATTTANGTGATNGTSTATAGEVAAEIAVGPGGKLVFSPEGVEITVGDTVRWIARSTGHNVSGKPDANGTVSLPRGAESFSSYSGNNHYTGLMQVGEHYEHTFETAGKYTYVCVPHALQGMVGHVTVME